MVKRINEEPALFAEVVRTALMLAVAFGVALTTSQVVAVMVFVSAALTFWTRKRVTPVVTAEARVQAAVDEAMGMLPPPVPGSRLG